MIWLIAKALIISESGTASTGDDEVPSVRFVAARQQMRAQRARPETVARAGPPAPCADSPSTATAISVRA